MGLSSSRLGSRPSPPRRRANNSRTTTYLSSLLICGASTSRAPVEMEDDPAELLVNSAEQSEAMDKFRSSTKKSILSSGTGFRFGSSRIETGASSENCIVASEDSLFEDHSGNVETNTQGKCLSESKELVPPHQLSDNYSCDAASTSYEDRPSPDLVSVNGRANIDIVYGVSDGAHRDMSEVCVGITQHSSPSFRGLGDSQSDGVSFENHVSQVMTMHDDSGSASAVSGSPVNFHPVRDDTHQEPISSGLEFLMSDREQGQIDSSVLHVDVVSISSNILSSSTAQISNREARRNSRRLFWDAFSRRSSRRHSDSRTFIFSTDNSDDLGTHDRWLLDYSGDFFNDGVGGDSGYLGSRTHSINERRWHSRSEIWERLHGGLDGTNRRTGICPSGLHPDGTCSCEPILTAEESGTRASISRIVMLAEALFEVLDEIHRQPVSLSLSVVSLPAPESVVDSFPVKNHTNPETSENGDDVAQCYICLAEYEEGDKIRVLPCHHEYHMSCVDKWLKEIHGICPLCRGDVREGFTVSSLSNSEIPST